ncbi:MAG: DUF4160 domain-containing protein [Gemmatimonadaceae bacterium]
MPDIGGAERPVVKAPAVLQARGVIRHVTHRPARGPFRLFCFSREEPRRYVPVSHPDGEATFWLQSETARAESVGLSARQLADAKDIVERHTGEIQDAWLRHVGA